MRVPMKWNKAECLQFLRDFDAFEHKYVFGSDARLKSVSMGGARNERTGKEREEAWNDILNAQSHGSANHNLSYDDEASAAMGIAQVYQDEERYTNEYIEMLNLVRDRFIYDYTGIDGLCEFFSPAYFEFEWGMHLEIDYRKHDSRYYRDHYVHQIRNLFEMFTLLDDYGYYEKCLNAYSNPESRVGTYIFEAIEQEMLSLTDTDRRYYRSILQIRGNSDVGNCCETTEEYHAAMRELMFHYIVYSATIITALVHDIGYPISYIRRISSRIGKNLPICQLLTSVSSDYASIEQALQTSLLFKIASKEKIRLRVNNTEEHGAQSAIVLLMYFCQHGEGLSILQHCAIEVAALMIYNHTNKYAVIGGKKDPDLIRSDIFKEPLSHIFRMCDDLQEWDRVYFEVTDQNNLKVCPVCGTPVTRLFASEGLDPCERKFFCCCREPKDGLFDTSWFISRRIINVIGCDEIIVDNIINRGDGTNFIGTKFTINFDCGALLNTLVFNNTFAKKRAKGIKELKILHSYQGMADSVLFDSFVSGNPFTVKIRILEQYGIERIKACFRDRQKEDCPMTTTDCVYKEWRKNIYFYLALYRIGCDFKKKCKDVFTKLSEAHNKNDVLNALSIDGITLDEILNKDKDAAEDFCSVEYNTTNPDVLKRYTNFYETLIKWLKKLAEKYLSENLNQVLREMDTEYSCSRFLQNEWVCQLAVDYMLQQVHLYAYEEVKNHIENINSETNKKYDVRLFNLYRVFYENLYCMSDKLCYCVDRYISRSDYEDVKRRISSKQSVDDRVDFFIDYALFIKLWNTAKGRPSYFFTARTTKEGNKHTSTFGDEDDTLYIRYLGDLEKGVTVLECITPESEFQNEYKFRIHKREGEKWVDNGSLTLHILHMEDPDGKRISIIGKLSNNDAMFKKLLEPLRIHHGFEWQS